MTGSVQKNSFRIKGNFNIYVLMNITRTGKVKTTRRKYNHKKGSATQMFYGNVTNGAILFRKYKMKT